MGTALSPWPMGKDHMLQTGVKEVLRGGGNAVDLRNGSDTQKARRGTQKCKSFGQPFPVFAHAALDVIKRAAQHMTVFINAAVFDGQKAFGIFGGHTEKSRQFPSIKARPDPPAAMAVATPTMLPVPMVADRAVHSAPKLVTSPSPWASLCTMYLSARPR